MMHVFVNPVAGRGAGTRLAQACAAWHPVLIEPDRLAGQLAARVAPGDTLVIAGGDGTASLVVDALFRLGLGTGVRAAIYPLGTGNDLVRALGAPVDPPAPVPFLERLARGEGARRDLTVWRTGARHFVDYLSLGLDAEILAQADVWRAQLPSSRSVRKLSLLIAGACCMTWRIRQAVRLETDAGDFPLRGLCGAIVSGIGHYMGGARIGPAVPTPGRLHVSLLRSPLDLVRLALSRGRPGGPPLAWTPVTSVRLAGADLPVQIDGEVGAFVPGPITAAGNLTYLV